LLVQRELAALVNAVHLESILCQGGAKRYLHGGAPLGSSGWLPPPRGVDAVMGLRVGESVSTERPPLRRGIGVVSAARPDSSLWTGKTAHRQAALFAMT
jgi:hypothetical protein